VGPGADEEQVVAIDPIDEQPIRLYVAVPKMLPLSFEGMIFAPGRKRPFVDQQLDHIGGL